MKKKFVKNGTSTDQVTSSEADARGTGGAPSTSAYTPATAAEIQARTDASLAGNGTFTYTDASGKPITLTGDAYRNSTDPTVVKSREEGFTRGTLDPNLLYGGKDNRTFSPEEHQYRERYNAMMAPKGTIADDFGGPLGVIGAMIALAAGGAVLSGGLGGGAGAAAGAAPAASAAPAAGLSFGTEAAAAAAAPAGLSIGSAALPEIVVTGTAGGGLGAGTAAGLSAATAGGAVAASNAGTANTGMQRTDDLGIFSNGGKGGMSSVGQGNMGNLVNGNTAASSPSWQSVAKNAGKTLSQQGGQQQQGYAPPPLMLSPGAPLPKINLLQKYAELLGKPPGSDMPVPGLRF